MERMSRVSPPSLGTGSILLTETLQETQQHHQNHASHGELHLAMRVLHPRNTWQESDFRRDQEASEQTCSIHSCARRATSASGATRNR